jgi:hypothetical protein
MPKSARVRFTSNLKDPQRAFLIASRDAAREAGRIIKEEIRSNIPPGGKGRFPGWETGSKPETGSLKTSIVAQAPRRHGNGWSVHVGVQRTRKAALYAEVHESGRIIRARNVEFMVFTNIFTGELIHRRTVVIKPKHYFADGVRVGATKAALELNSKFLGMLNL